MKEETCPECGERHRADDDAGPFACRRCAYQEDPHGTLLYNLRRDVERLLRLKGRYQAALDNAEDHLARAVAALYDAEHGERH
jgi:tRNA(Ile2) C34 agmatinyltransferase TiaS